MPPDLTLALAPLAVRVIALMQSGVNSTLGFLADPNVAYVLLVLGFLGFFLELATPGTTVPGAIGLVCLILAAIGLSQLPFDWRGALLILVAFLLFFADLFLPSLGLLTITGLLLLIAGSYVLFDPNSGATISRPLIWSIAVALVALFAVIGGFALSVLRRKPATGREGLIGAVGTVRKSLDPDGTVFVRGELWQATAAGDTVAADPPIGPRVAVAVTRVDGLRLFVRRATASEIGAAGVAVVGDVPATANPEAALPLADTP